jgi:hypothetical protein
LGFGFATLVGGHGGLGGVFWHSQYPRSGRPFVGCSDGMVLIARSLIFGIVFFSF